MKVAFIGLGVMGYPMAGHLKQAGHEVIVYNRTRSKAQRWASEYGANRIAETPAEASRDAEIVITCVGNDQDLRAVILGTDGAASTMNTGAVLVDHTTASANIARELAEQLQAWQIGFVDAPVSGGQQGAINGQLTIMCGGNAKDFTQIENVIGCYARQVRLMGPAGSGQLTKMVNQICIAGLIQSLAEGLQFAIRAGLDPVRVIEVISKGAAQSWQMENRYQSMIEGRYDHGFAVDWMRKDLAICLEEAQQNGSDLPIAALVDQFYSEIQNIGGGRWDTSSLLKRLQQD